MVIYDLICGKEHVFEGWFASLESYEEQRANRQLSCPICGSKKITRLPNACAVHTKKEPAKKMDPRPTDREVATRTRPVSPEEVKEALIRLHHHVQAHFEDMGPGFAKEAVRIQHGEAEERPIHGTATAVEREELDEANVSYVVLPKPELDS